MNSSASPAHRRTTGTFRATLALVLGVTSAIALTACSSEIDVANRTSTGVHSGWKTLELRRTSAMGFCATDGTFYHAKVTRDAQGAVVTGEVLVKAPEGTRSEQCLLGGGGSECFQAGPTFEARLSAAELDGLEAQVSRVPEAQCKLDSRLACDPCLVSNLTIDNAELSSFCCGAWTAATYPAEYDALLKKVDALATKARDKASYWPSDWTTLQVHRGPAMGYCATADTFYDVKVTRDAEGALVRGQVFKTAAAGTPESECVAGRESGKCLTTSTTFEARLTAAELSALTEQVPRVPVAQCKQDSRLACDPCLTETIRLDGTDLPTSCCGSWSDSNYAAAQAALLNKVDALAAKAK